MKKKLRLLFSSHLSNESIQCPKCSRMAMQICFWLFVSQTWKTAECKHSNKIINFTIEYTHSKWNFTDQIGKAKRENSKEKRQNKLVIFPTFVDFRFLYLVFYFVVRYYFSCFFPSILNVNPAIEGFSWCILDKSK